jgi:hypothetical protein
MSVETNSWEEISATLKKYLHPDYLKAMASGPTHLRIHQWLLQSASSALSTGLEKPGQIRKKSSLNEHQGRHKNGAVQEEKFNIAG